jgi:hypothetical protein
MGTKRCDARILSFERVCVRPWHCRILTSYTGPNIYFNLSQCCLHSTEVYICILHRMECFSALHRSRFAPLCSTALWLNLGVAPVDALTQSVALATYCGTRNAASNNKYSHTCQPQRGYGKIQPATLKSHCGY